MPSGSRPFAGSSSTSTAGSASSAWARPSRWRMPRLNSPTRRSCGRREADEVEDGVDPPFVDAGGHGGDPQAVPRGAPGVEARRLEQRADLAEGVRQVDVAAPADGCGAARRRDQAEQASQGGGLAGAVRTPGSRSRGRAGP